MPRRPMTAEQRAQISRAQKARWAKTRLHRTPVHLDGHSTVSVEARIILHVKDEEYILSLGDARQLREALAAALAPTEPTHE